MLNTQWFLLKEIFPGAEIDSQSQYDMKVVIEATMVSTNQKVVVVEVAQRDLFRKYSILIPKPA